MKRVATVVLLVLAAGGCATKAETISRERRLVPGESLVIGRLEMLRLDGQRASAGPAWLVGYMSLTANNEARAKTYVITCDLRGDVSDFYVSLPPGRYRITEWKWGTRTSQPQAWFDVVPRQPLVYVGTLRFTGGASIWSQLSGDFSVVDEADSTVRRFRERFPQFRQAVARSLMRTAP